MAKILQCDRCKKIHKGVLVRDVLKGSYSEDVWEPPPARWTMIWTRLMTAPSNTSMLEYSLCHLCTSQLQTFLGYQPDETDRNTDD